MARLSFEDLINNNDFADVTLAYEDGQQGEADKVMLSYHISTCGLAKHNKKVLSSVRPNVVDLAREDCNCLPSSPPCPLLDSV